MFDIGIGNLTINDYNLNVNSGNTNTYLGSTTLSYIQAKNATSDALGTINANFQQHIAEPNMSYSSNIIVTNKSVIEGSDSNISNNATLMLLKQTIKNIFHRKNGLFNEFSMLGQWVEP